MSFSSKQDATTSKECITRYLFRKLDVLVSKAIMIPQAGGKLFRAKVKVKNIKAIKEKVSD